MDANADFRRLDAVRASGETGMPRHRESGVRPAGLSCSRALIISTNRNQLPMPVLPMGACMVVQASRLAGHEVELLDLMYEKSPGTAIQEVIQRLQPDIVGLSVRNIDNNDMGDTVFFLQDLRQLVTAVRRCTPAPVVLGGAALAVMPEEILRFAESDYAIPGDGELTFRLMLDCLAKGEPLESLPGTAFLEEGIFRRNPSPAVRPAADCPSPDYRSLLQLGRYLGQMANVPVQSKLGCQFDCVYCTYRKIEGSIYRMFSPESVADAVEQYAACGMRDIEFVDNIFNVPCEHAMAVCASLARRRHGARLQTLELNPLCISHGLITAMERAGFVGIGITVESAADAVLKGLRKGFSSGDVVHAAEVIRSHRLPCTWIFLLGGPGETMQTVRETLQFAHSAIRPRDIAFFNAGLRIYPGTELEEIARGQGVLGKKPADMLSPVFYVSPRVNPEWLQQQVRQATASHMNFLSSGTISLPFLPAINRFARRMGIRPPLWRYTPAIRRGLDMFGVATG